MIKFLKINWILLRNAYIRDSKIQGFILVNILIQFLDITVSLVFFQVVFANTLTLSGWNFYQVIFLYAFAKAIGTLHNSWTKKGLGSMTNEMVRLGDYDFYLTKPFNSMILVSISRPRLYTLIALTYEIGLMIYAAGHSGIQITAMNYVWFFVLAAISFVLYYVLRIFTIVPVFWLTKTGALYDLMDRMTNFLRYPAGIYPRVLLFILSTVFPIILISYLPVRTLFYPPKIIHIIYMIAITIFFAFLAQKIWQLGEKKYGSASS